ncbi:MAG: alpha/beta hydrolase [Planctomycetaceae bacterium]|nr:alpha/beta hydrolase [Planctomycetaceae bacterium]
MSATRFFMTILLGLTLVSTAAAQEIETKLNIPYADNDNPRQALDLYLPTAKSEKPRPVIVFIHGGGWRNGDKKSGRGRLLPFVRSGEYAGVSVGYRLTDEAQWPSQIHDCKAAIRWIRAHAGEYNLDPEKIGIMGTSAGGHLVAMLGTSGGLESLEGELGQHNDEDSRVTCVVDFYGPTEMLTMGKSPGLDHNAPGSPEAKLLGGPIQEVKEIARQASPITHVSKDDAPFLIIHGTNDPLVPFEQSTRFQKKLKEAGVEATLITIKDGKHGGFRNRQMDQMIQAFFYKHLRGIERPIEDQTLENEPRRQR